MNFTDEEISAILNTLDAIPKAVHDAIKPINEARLREIEVSGESGSRVLIKVRDLKEILFNYSGDSTIAISSHLLYKLLIERGIKIHGFKPNKTALRHQYGLSIDEVNKILPGSFTSEEGDGRRKGNRKNRPVE